MKEFNYQDYLKYELLKEKENILSELREPNEKYQVHQPHDKLIKTVLSEKSQMVGLLNKVLDLKVQLIEEDIEIYNTKHINYMFQNSESDIVYKMKKKEIFFLIEHQQKIDYNMPKRILEYEVEIIKEAIKGKIMTKKEHTLPRVIPIVIYTGDGKWNVEKYIEECQEVLTEANRVKLGEYYVLDVNDYTNEELEKDKLFLSKILLLEKLKTEKEIFNILNNTIEDEKDEQIRVLLKRTIAFILAEKLKEGEKEILLRKLENKEEKDMVLEVIRKENERLRREGIKEGKREGKLEAIKKSVKNMLQFGEDEEKIMKYIGISKEELENIKGMLVNS